MTVFVKSGFSNQVTHFIAKPVIYLSVVIASIHPGLLNNAHAHSYALGGIEIGHPYAPVIVPGMRNGAVYFRTLYNKGQVSDRLLSAHSEVAERVELHQVLIQDGIMRMREVDSIALSPGSKPSFRHGQSSGYHLMLVNLKAHLKNGDRFRVLLRFEKSGDKEVIVFVQDLKTSVTEHH